MPDHIDNKEKTETPKITIIQAMGAMVAATECTPMSDHSRTGFLQIAKDFIEQESPPPKATDSEGSQTQTQT